MNEERPEPPSSNGSAWWLEMGIGGKEQRRGVNYERYMQGEKIAVEVKHQKHPEEDRKKLAGQQKARGKQ